MSENNHNLEPESIERDEISLTEIFKSIWEGKWLIAAVSAFCLVLGSLYAYTQPTTVRLSLDLNILNDEDFLAYESYNHVSSNKLFSIEKSTLSSLFIQELNDIDKWIRALSKQRLLNEVNFNEQQYSENEIVSLANRFKISSHTDLNDKNQHWSIIYAGKLIGNETDIIEDVLKTSTEAVRIFLQKKFKSAKTIYSDNLEINLEELNNKIDNQIAIYDQKTRNEVAFLNEQAQIARALGVKRNTIEAQTFQSNDQIITNLTNNDSFYLRGYEAIEKQIDLLKNRASKEAYIDELVELYDKKRALKQINIADRAQMAFNTTPIVQGGFKAVEYDIRSINMQKQNKTKLTLALSIFLGLMLSLFVLLVQNDIRKIKLKTKKIE